MRIIIIFTLILNISSFAKEYEFVMVEKLAIQKIGKEIVSTIYHEIGVDIKITAYPGKRASKLVAENLVDGEIMRAYLYGNAFNNLIRVPTPIYSIVNTAYYKKNSSIEISSNEDLAKYRLGIIRGIKATESLAEGGKSVNYAAEIKQLFDMLLKDRVDIVLTNTFIAKQILNSVNYKNIVSSENIIQNLSFHHYINKEHSELANQVNNKIIELKKDGRLDIIIKKAEKKVLSQNNL